MSSFLRYLFLWCSLALGLPTASIFGRSISTVVIDAGHGAHDFGCRDGALHEKHLALDISRRLERYCRRIGLRTLMTRSSDRFVPLETRAAIGNAQGSSAVFVSIHVNDATRSGASGIETFYYNSSGQALASLVQQQILSTTNNGGNRGVKHARYKVLRASSLPAILVETGFISNGGDHRRLRDPAYREAIAQAIGDALQSYRRL